MACWVKKTDIYSYFFQTRMPRWPRWPCIAHLITRKVLRQWLEAQYRFLRWQAMEAILDLQYKSKILGTFDLQDIILWMTFQINWSFGSGEEGQKRFSTWQLWRPSSISNQNNFSYFWSTSHLDTSYQVLRQMAFLFKIDFQDCNCGSHLGFPIGIILAIFDLQVAPILPTKFPVNWPFGSEEEAENRFSRWLPWWSYWISDQTDFSYFWSLFVLRFYGPVNPMGSCRARSVYLTTRLLGRLSPLSG